MLILFYDLMWGAPLDFSPGGTEAEFSTDRARHDAADAVVFHLPEWPCAAPAPEKRPGQIWVAWSMESEEHYPAMRDPCLLAQFDLSMTYKRGSDIPLNYADPFGPISAMVAAFRRPPPAQRRDPLVASFISSPWDRSGRRAYKEELARHLAIDSYGRFMRNRTLDPDLGRTSKLEAIAGYRFTLAFENSRDEDYVTEKFFDPLWVGSVPVYLGAPNVEEFAPGDRCFINVADYPDPHALATYLLGLARDEAAYRSYFAWKDKPFRRGFEELLENHARHWLVRLAARVREHRAGCRQGRQPAAPLLPLADSLPAQPLNDLFHHSSNGAAFLAT